MNVSPNMLPVVVFALVYYDLGEHDVTWNRCVEVWEGTYLPALTEAHFGDCTNQPQACIRCQAEDCIRLADILKVGIEHEHEWTEMRNEVTTSGEWCRSCGAIR